MKLFYSPQYVAAAHDFPTTRKAAWIADSLATEPIAGVELVAPQPLSAASLAEIHDADYVESVRTGEPLGRAQSQGFTWDPGLFGAVAASNGGAVAAALAALEDGVAGSLSSGLHHARRFFGYAFCTFNGLVLAALAARRAGARRVLILDLDAHCGGGTVSLLTECRLPAEVNEVAQIDISVSPVDSYNGQPPRLQLDIIDAAELYMLRVSRRLKAVQAGTFDLCIYNAGMDCHEHDMGIKGINNRMLAEREKVVFDWARRQRLPVAFVLAGGYMDPAKVVALHRLTIAEAVKP